MSYARQMLDTYQRTVNLDPGLLAAAIDAAGAVSYTHLTLPTILRV